MCAPAAPIISAVAGIGVAALQAGASYSASEADYQAKAAAWRQNVINAESAARDEQVQIIGQQLIQQNKIAQQKHVSFLEQAQKEATVAVSAAEGGVSGISVDNVMQDIATKSQLNRTYADQNYSYIVADTVNKLKSSDDQEISRINSVERPVEPSPLAAIAGVAGAGVKAFGTLSNSGSMGDF
jgi:hypothetical protein